MHVVSQMMLFAILLASPLEAAEKLSTKLLNKLEQGSQLVKVDVESLEENKLERQKLHYSIAGLHSKSCRVALRKLSKYEDFKNHMSFVKESEYFEKTQTVRFLLDHTVLPHKFILRFQVPRIKKPGTYPFEFPDGIFKGLRGVISVKEHKGRCLFQTWAQWKGEHTGLPAPVVELFAITLSKLGMAKLFRISQF